MLRYPGRRRWLLACLVTAIALAGCENLDRGLSGRDAEFDRRRGEQAFTVVQAAGERAIFTARDREIVVEPPEGYCLDTESIQLTSRSAFVLVADCLESHQEAIENGVRNGNNGEIPLPRSFPGIMTITISGEAALGSGPAGLATFETLLGSDAGMRLLGRGENAAPGRIAATRRIEGALYVLIEQPAESRGLIFAPRFWRAFGEINGRLVLVTVSSFNDRPIAEDVMMGFVAAQMARLRRANGQPASEEEDEIAEGMTAALRLAESQGAWTGSLAWSGDGPVDTAGGGAPLPPVRVTAGEATAAATGGGSAAPVQAPVPPRRPVWATSSNAAINRG